jgi:hypothetical protein
MAVNPISVEAIDAFCRRFLVDMSVWEAELLCRLDDTVLAVWAGSVKRPAPDHNAPPEPIPASHPRGIKALLQGLAVRRGAK